MSRDQDEDVRRVDDGQSDDDLPDDDLVDQDLFEDDLPDGEPSDNELSDDDLPDDGPGGAEAEIEGDPDQPVVVARRPSIYEANLVAGKLCSEGLDAVVEANAAVDVLEFVQNMSSAGGIGVMVPRRQAARAEAIMASVEARRQRRIEAREANPPSPADDLDQTAADAASAAGRSDFDTGGLIGKTVILCLLALGPLALVPILRMFSRYRRDKSALSHEAQGRIRQALWTSVFIMITVSAMELVMLFVIWQPQGLFDPNFGPTSLP